MFRKLILLVLVLLIGCTSIFAATISGQLKKWHKVTLLFDGPNTGEGAVTNPFLDYRLIVTFTNGGNTHVVQGHYAADGNASETSDTSGNKWRVYFTPDATGTWNYSVSFRTGADIALSDVALNGTAVGSPNGPDGETGTFAIAATNKSGSDFRAKGRLEYVGEHYLQFAETGEYYIKGGADSPENLLGYYEFDQTLDMGGITEPGLNNGLHEFGPHVAHWHAGDPTWQSGKGKGIIGALNYLASMGMNSIYFLTYNVDGGDGRDTWMWTSDTERERFDVSKLDQWEVVFSHADSLGIQLHFVTQETENDELLGGNANLNNIRKLYYRELVSRFAHHLAIVWNLGEENDNTDVQRVAFAQYIREKDPYDSPITFHTYQNQALSVYDPILNDPNWLQYFEMTSLQGTGTSYNNWARTLRTDSETAGRKWIICGDEQDPTVDPGMTESNLHDLRKNPLWGNLMGGGGGVEWYFGYQNTFGDIQSEDWTIVEELWNQTRYALDFFHTYLPFHQMEGDNTLLSGGNGYCFYKAGEVYAFYLKDGGNGNDVTVNIPVFGSYDVKWYNPRTGGALINGSVTTVSGGGSMNLGPNPDGDSNDWVVLVKDDAVVIPTATTWTGNNWNNDWFNSNNWTSGIPAATMDVTIPNVSPKPFPIIQGGPGIVAEVTNLTIGTGASITISGTNNVELIIHGNLTNAGQIAGTGKLTFNGPSHVLTNQLLFGGVLQVKAGANLITNGNLILQDGASLLAGTGTINGGGTVTGTIIMKRNASINPTVYSYWSSPVSGANVSLLGNNLYQYNTNKATDNSIAGLSNGWESASGTMTDARGYIGRGNSQVAFNGDPHDGNYITSITKNAITDVPWNLIGNPYPSGIDATAFMAVNGPAGSNPVITGSIYFWDDDASNGTGYAMQDYAVWSGAGSIAGPNSGLVFQGHIAACQGFFVEKLTNGNSTVLFTNSMRNSINNAFFRQAPVERFWLSAVSPDGDYNETLVAFIEDATDGADLLYDSKKLKGSNKIALYTKIQNEDYAIQAIPSITDDKSLTLGIDAGMSGVYTLNLKTIENIDETLCIYLEDTYSGYVQDLRLNPAYSFTTSPGVFGDRFILHFTAPLEVSVKTASCAGGDADIILAQNGAKIWDYVIADINGVTISSQTNFNGNSMLAGLNAGNYFLTLQDNNGYTVMRNIEVTGATPVTADYSPSVNEAFVDEQISFNNLSTGAASYEWDFGDGTVTADVNPSHAYAHEGMYEVSLLAENDDCSRIKSASVVVLKNESTSIGGIDEESLNVYSSGSSIFVQFGSAYSKNVTIDVINSIGKRVFRLNLSAAATQKIDLHDIAAGIYYLVIRDSNIQTTKVLITK